MASQISCKLNYFNANARNASLLERLNLTRHKVWPLTSNENFDRILNQRIFLPADYAVMHLEEGHYESAIAMCATSAEMLTYFLFFVYTNSFEIPTENEFNSTEKFELVGHAITQANISRKTQITTGECEEINYQNSFSDKGNQSNRIAVLKNCKISKQDYNCNGEGHDIKLICKLLKELRDVRVKYLHHWTLFADEDRQKNAEDCVCNLYNALGHTFEMDPSHQPGILSINASIMKWISNSPLLR